MNLPDALLPSLWVWLGHIGFWPVLLYAVARAPWFHLKEAESLHVWLGATVALLLLWSIKAGIAVGLSLHLLGMTVLTLMFGWQFAIISVTLILLGTTLNGVGGWQAFGLNALVMGVLPITVSHLIYRAVDRHLPNNFFIYIFVSAFATGALAMGLVGVVSSIVLLLIEAYTLDYLAQFYLPYYLMMLFPEAFVTGMFMSLFVVYRPRWVSTFNDERYLMNK